MSGEGNRNGVAMAMSRAIIYVVDDDVSVCRALSLFLESRGFAVKTFGTAREFLAAKHPRRAACLILDVRLPDVDGLALQQAMGTEQLLIPIVFITGQGDIPTSVKAMKGGAVDFLVKPFSNEELLDALEIAIAKHNNENKRKTNIITIQRRIKLLSPREYEVFVFVAKGMLSKQIAFKRGISLQTIKVHRSRVMQKMQAKTVTELIGFAKKAGIIPSR